MANDDVICVFKKDSQLFIEKIGGAKDEKRTVKEQHLKNVTVDWDRTRYLVVCPNVLAATSKVVANPLRQPIRGICGSELVE